MDYNKEWLLLDILSKFVREESIIVPEGIDWEALTGLARRQSLSGILFPALHKSAAWDSIPPAVMTKLKQHYQMTLTRSVQLDYALQSLIQLLNDNQIPHMLIKGTTVKQYYPIPELRTMGDVDILVHTEDQGKIRKALESNGFTYIHDESGVLVYDRGDLHLEVHDCLMYIPHRGQERSALPGLWENAVADGYTYRLNNEYVFIVLFTHMAKHLERLGCGARMILDIVFMIKNCKDLNLEMVYREMCVYTLDQVFISILSYCRYIFGVDICISVPLKDDPEMFEEISRELLNSGTHGIKLNKEMDQFVASIDDQKYRGRRGATLIYMKEKFFPPFDFMKKSCCYLNRAPFLLPVAYIHRIGRLIFKRSSRKTAGNVFTNVISASDESVEAGLRRNKLLDKIGFR